MWDASGQATGQAELVLEVWLYKTNPHKDIEYTASSKTARRIKLSSDIFLVQAVILLLTSS
jgi:hypothetical protein